MSHSTHNTSFQRWDFSGNRLHWYWQAINKETKLHIHPKQKRETEETAIDNKTIYTLIWYTCYDLQPGNAAGPILTVPEAARGKEKQDVVLQQVCSNTNRMTLTQLTNYTQPPVSAVQILYGTYFPTIKWGFTWLGKAIDSRRWPTGQWIDTTMSEQFWAIGCTISNSRLWGCQCRCFPTKSTAARLQPCTVNSVTILHCVHKKRPP